MVTSVLQTAAGRMIFAKLGVGDKKLIDHDSSPSYDEVNIFG